MSNFKTLPMSESLLGIQDASRTTPGPKVQKDKMLIPWFAPLRRNRSVQPMEVPSTVAPSQSCFHRAAPRLVIGGLVGASLVVLFVSRVYNRDMFVTDAITEVATQTRAWALRKTAPEGYDLAGHDVGMVSISSSSILHLDTACRNDWAGTWSASPARSLFTGNVTVTQVGCNVTVYWWEFVYDWFCRGLWVSGWIQLRSDYKASGQDIILISKDECSGGETWRPSNMVLSADGNKASCSSEVWTREPPAPPKPPLPHCLPLGECAVGFSDGFGPSCCDGLVLQPDYSSACRHRVGKYGYPEAGNSCQKKQCLQMGSDCFGDQEGCCPGLRCLDEGISGFMCA